MGRARLTWQTWSAGRELQTAQKSLDYFRNFSRHELKNLAPDHPLVRQQSLLNDLAQRYDTAVQAGDKTAALDLRRARIEATRAFTKAIAEHHDTAASNASTSTASSAPGVSLAPGAPATMAPAAPATPGVPPAPDAPGAPAAIDAAGNSNAPGSPNASVPPAPSAAASDPATASPASTPAAATPATPGTTAAPPAASALSGSPDQSAEPNTSSASAASLPGTPPSTASDPAAGSTSPPAADPSTTAAPGDVIDQETERNRAAGIRGFHKDADQSWHLEMEDGSLRLAGTPEAAIQMREALIRQRQTTANTVDSNNTGNTAASPTAPAADASQTSSPDSATSTPSEADVEATADSFLREKFGPPRDSNTSRKSADTESDTDTDTDEDDGLHYEEDDRSYFNDEDLTAARNRRRDGNGDFVTKVKDLTYIAAHKVQSGIRDAGRLLQTLIAEGGPVSRELFHGIVQALHRHSPQWRITGMENAMAGGPNSEDITRDNRAGGNSQGRAGNSSGRGSGSVQADQEAAAARAKAARIARRSGPPPLNLPELRPATLAKGAAAARRFRPVTAFEHLVALAELLHDYGLPGKKDATRFDGGAVTNPKWGRSEGWTLPATEGEWLGAEGNSAWKSHDKDINKLTDGRPVHFREGAIDLGPYTVLEYAFKGLDGGRNDFKRADKRLMEVLGLRSVRQARLWRKRVGFTWHHHQNGATLQLVPTGLNNEIPHFGGAAIIKRLLTIAGQSTKRKKRQ